MYWEKVYWEKVPKKYPEKISQEKTTQGWFADMPLWTQINTDLAEKSIIVAIDSINNMKGIKPVLG